MLDPATATATATADVASKVVTYTAVLPMSARVVGRVADLLAEHRAVIGTRAGRRALSCFDQAVAFGHWMLQAVKVADLRVDLAIASSTTYTYLHEALAVVAAQAPSLHAALLAARVAGHDHVSIDGTLVPTDRLAAPGPTNRKTRGKNRRRVPAGQASTPPQKVDRGFPRLRGRVVGQAPLPRGEHPGDHRPRRVAAVGLTGTPWARARHHPRTHPGLLAALSQWVDPEHAVLGDLGYQGEQQLITVPVKAPSGTVLPEPTKAANRAHNGLRARAEAGNAWLKMRYTALRRVTMCPWRIGAITAAALVLLHLEHDRTT